MSDVQQENVDKAVDSAVKALNERDLKLFLLNAQRDKLDLQVQSLKLALQGIYKVTIKDSSVFTFTKQSEAQRIAAKSGGKLSKITATDKRNWEEALVRYEERLKEVEKAIGEVR